MATENNKTNKDVEPQVTEQKQEQGQTHQYLHRSSTNSMIGGVAGGIGEYFAIDPTVVRLVFVFLGFLNGLGVVLYLIMWVIMPSDVQSGSGNSSQNIQANMDEVGKKFSSVTQKLQSERARNQWGWVLVGIGLLLILFNYGLLDIIQWQVFWPVILILVGLFIISRRQRG